MHEITMSQNARVFVDTFSNTDTPPNVTLRNAAGAVLTVLVPNKLDAGHPYGPYADAHVQSEFGTIDAAAGRRCTTGCSGRAIPIRASDIRCSSTCTAAPACSA